MNNKKVATDAGRGAVTDEEIFGALWPYVKRHYEIERDVRKIDVESSWEKLKAELHKLDQKGG